MSCGACFRCSLFWTKMTRFSQVSPQVTLEILRQEESEAANVLMDFVEPCSHGHFTYKPMLERSCQHVFVGRFLKEPMDVSKNSGTPKSSILIRCSIINHPFRGTPISGNTQIVYLKNTDHQEPCSPDPPQEALHAAGREDSRHQGIEETKTFEPCPKTSKTWWESNVFF